MYMFLGDVRFSWQGSVLINVTSIFRVGILVSSGIPHEFLFTHPNRGLSPRFLPNPGGGCLTLPLLQRISKQRSPQMKKGNAFDLHFVGTHFVSTVLHVYMYMYIYIGTCYKVRVDIYIYIHLSKWIVLILNMGLCCGNNA